MKNNILIIALSLFFWSCGSESGTNGETVSVPTGIDNTSFVSGERIYRAKCMACHQENGEGGVGGLYPPLAGSDYLMADLNRAICITKNGINGKITVNGKDYDAMMPPVSGLSPEKIRDLMTYIRNSWGNKGGMISVEDVAKSLEDCQ